MIFLISWYLIVFRTDSFKFRQTNQESKTYEIKLQSHSLLSVPCSQVSLLTFRFPLIICTQNGSFGSFICVCSFSLFEKLSTKKKKELCTHLQNLETPILFKIIVNTETNTSFSSGITDHVVQRDRNNSSNSFTGKTSLEKRIRAVLNFIALVPFPTICLLLGTLGVDSRRLYLRPMPNFELFMRPTQL